MGKGEQNDKERKEPNFNCYRTTQFVPRPTCTSRKQLTYLISEWNISASGTLSTRRNTFVLNNHLSLPSKMPSTSKEARVILALEAIKASPKIGIRAAAKLYNVPASTLCCRRAGRPARRDTTPNSKKLTQSEEEAIVQYIIELVVRAFLPRLSSVEDIANQLLRVRDAPPVGQLWAHRFVRRQPELQTRYTCRYNY